MKVRYPAPTNKMHVDFMKRYLKAPSLFSRMYHFCNFFFFFTACSVLFVGILSSAGMYPYCKTQKSKKNVCVCSVCKGKYRGHQVSRRFVAVGLASPLKRIPLLERANVPSPPHLIYSAPSAPPRRRTHLFFESYPHASPRRPRALPGGEPGVLVPGEHVRRGREEG